jgi:hypothetical protein
VIAYELGHEGRCDYQGYRDQIWRLSIPFFAQSIAPASDVTDCGGSQ